ncbi:ImmA/IrrE family metallo-endopeptidase [Pseudactinotalea sp. HY160]|uniref:ImmA/IrrE family metallo-endopeptidase n=1 Tax=Pseudactinotalea sp. HY160 TaxID=2654490 RepID=UPI00351B99A4
MAVIDAEPDEHGLTMRDPVRGIVFIGVARTRRPMRQRSSLAHEIAHVLFGDWNRCEDLSARSMEEIRADSFARHLLVPLDGLREFLGDRESVSEADLSATVQRFLASPAIVSIALHDCGYIDTPTKTRWMSLSTPQLATRFGWSDQYHSLQEDSNRTRPPQRLLARAISGYEEGVVTTQTIATLRGISAEHAAAELADAGVVPHDYVIPSLSAEDLPVVDVDLSDLDEPNPSEPNE